MKVNLIAQKYKPRHILLTLITSLCLLVEPFGIVVGNNTAAAAPLSGATQLSTGAESTCAIANAKAYCWGNGSNGRLGTNSSASQTKPAAVYTNPGYEEKVTCSAFEKIFGCKDSVKNHGASPLYGKSVTRISVGADHACAVADAAVYCWGSNSKGQLGNGRTGGQEAAPVAVIRSGNSPLKNKEITDVSAGEDFTCALASDGVVACWGSNDYGKLGTNDDSDKNTPTVIYAAAGKTETRTVTINVATGAEVSPCTGGSKSNSAKSAASQSRYERCMQEQAGMQKRQETRTTVTPPSAMYNKKAVKLAKASKSTMCVVAIENGSQFSGSGNAYCWGEGIHDGQVIPGSGTSTVACSADSPSNRPSGTTTDTEIFESKRPQLISGDTVSHIDGQDYVTALGANSRAYYWGMYGYQETATYSNIKTCRLNTCTGKVSAKIERSNDTLTIDLAKPKDMGAKAKDNAKKGNTDNRGKPKVVNGHPGMANYQIDKDNDKDDDNCGYEYRYGYTKTYTAVPVGKKVTTQPSAWPGAQSGFRTLSGNVNNGLFCASNGTSTQCDAHGTSQTEGQTGSGYTQTCKLFAGCTPPLPSGPQGVSGWISGKQVTQLATSRTGFSCAIANGSVGCWGVNNKGQLGVGDTKVRNIPTEAGL